MLGAAFTIAALSPSSAEAQFNECDKCNFDGEWAVCILHGGGFMYGCSQPTPAGCGLDGLCWPFWPNEQQAVNPTDVDDEAILTSRTFTRPCVSNLVAWTRARAEVTERDRRLRILVVS